MAFYQAPLEEERIFLKSPPEAQVSPDSLWEAPCAFPGLKEAPQASEEDSAQELEKLGMTRGRYYGCMFQRRSDQSKAGRQRTTSFQRGLARRSTSSWTRGSINCSSRM